MKTILLSALLAFSLESQAQDLGSFSLFRWNPGQKAARDPALLVLLDEKSFAEALRDPDGFAAQHKDTLFSGCYLTRFERPLRSRALATARANTHKICFYR